MSIRLNPTSMRVSSSQFISEGAQDRVKLAIQEFLDNNHDLICHHYPDTQTSDRDVQLSVFADGRVSIIGPQGTPIALPQSIGCIPEILREQAVWAPAPQPVPPMSPAQPFAYPGYYSPQPYAPAPMFTPPAQPSTASVDPSTKFTGKVKIPAGTMSSKAQHAAQIKALNERLFKLETDNLKQAVDLMELRDLPQIKTKIEELKASSTSAWGLMFRNNETYHANKDQLEALITGMFEIQADIAFKKMLINADLPKRAKLQQEEGLRKDLMIANLKIEHLTSK